MITAQLCEEIEETNLSYYPLPETDQNVNARLFAPNAMTLNAIHDGYEASPDYRWLRQNGSMEGKSEMQTIVREKYDTVIKRTEQILRDHGLEPEPKRQKREPEATAPTMGDD